jgi:hypothetical protein
MRVYSSHDPLALLYRLETAASKFASDGRNDGQRGYVCIYCSTMVRYHVAENREVLSSVKPIATRELREHVVWNGLRNILKDCTSQESVYYSIKQHARKTEEIKTLTAIVTELNMHERKSIFRQ